MALGANNSSFAPCHWKGTHFIFSLFPHLPLTPKGEHNPQYENLKYTLRELSLFNCKKLIIKKNYKNVKSTISFRPQLDKRNSTR